MDNEPRIELSHEEAAFLADATQFNLLPMAELGIPPTKRIGRMVRKIYGYKVQLTVQELAVIKHFKDWNDRNIRINNGDSNRTTSH